MIIINDVNKLFWLFIDRINKARWFYAPIGLCLAINLIMFGINVYYLFKHRTNFESFLWTMVKYVLKLHWITSNYEYCLTSCRLVHILNIYRCFVQVFISSRWNRCRLDLWNFLRNFCWRWNWIQVVSLLMLLLNVV